MRKALRGFSFFEAIIYLGIFSMMATALLNFSWDVLDLGTKGQTERRVFSDARFVTERLNYLIRSASGIDTGASVFDDANGKLVLNQSGSSDTATIDIQNGRLTLNESGTDVALHSGDSQVESLTFLDYGTAADHSEYVGFTLVMISTNSTADTDAQYRATTTIESGAFIRNSGL